MAWQLNNRTLKAKLRRLPTSVVCSASHQPLLIKNQQLRENASLSIFYLPDNFQPQTRFHSIDFYNSTHPKGLKPHLQHYIVSSDSLISSSSGSNGLTSGSTLPKRSLRRSDEINCPGSPTVSSRQEHTRSELPGGIQGSDHSHRELRISLYRNPSGDSRGNADITGRFWTSPVLHEVPEIPIPSPTATPEVERTLPQGLPKLGRGFGDAEHGGRNLPTATGSGIWSPPLSRTTWWSLSD